MLAGEEWRFAYSFSSPIDNFCKPEAILSQSYYKHIFLASMRNTFKSSQALFKIYTSLILSSYVL